MKSAYYIVILIIGSATLYSKIKQLRRSIDAGNMDKIRVDVLFLCVTLAVIGGLVALGQYNR